MILLNSQDRALLRRTLHDREGTHIVNKPSIKPEIYFSETKHADLPAQGPRALRRLGKEHYITADVLLLDEPTLAIVLPKGPQIRRLDIALVVDAHDAPDGARRFVRVVEGNARVMVMQHVRFDRAVKEVAADEAEVAVDGGGGAPEEGPALGGVVGQ